MTALHPISLAAIRSHKPCEDGWITLLRSLGSPPKAAWAATYVTLGDVAASNGAADAWWCVRALPAEARRDVIRALMPAVRRAATHTTDARVHDCIGALAEWIAGRDVNLRASAVAAETAEAEAEAAAEAAARAAVRAAAEAEARAAVEAAAEAAARAAVEAAAGAERQSQVSDIVSVFGRTAQRRSDHGHD